MTTLGPRNVRHFDLAAPLPALDDDGRGVYAVFWSHGVPLGQLDLGPDRLPMPAPALAEEALRAVTPALWGYLFAPEAEAGSPPGVPPFAALAALARPLDQLAERLVLPPDAAADLSVVVCTRDRPEDLDRCLDALARLSQPPLEVVVVDNASRDGQTRAVAEKHPGVRYVHEPRPGLDRARNAGIRHSRGRLVAFTDDDVAVHPDWAARLAVAFHDPAVRAVCGLVLPAELETEAQVLFETEWSLGRRCVPCVYGPLFFRQGPRQVAPVWEIGAGANMAFRRAAFDEVGAFDERLDVGAAGCSGDSEMWYRILAAGGSIRYEPAAVVHHTHRRDLAGLHRQIHHYMRGHVAALLVQHAQHRHRGNLWRLLTLPVYHARLARRRLFRGVEPRTATLREEVSGALAGVGYYLAHRRRPAYDEPYGEQGQEEAQRRESAPEKKEAPAPPAAPTLAPLT